MSVMRLRGFLDPLAIVLAAAAVVFGVLVAGAQAGNTHPTGIPGSVKRVLLERAKSLAAEGGDSHPNDIQAVRTTEAKVRSLKSLGSSDPQLSASEPVYIVALRGHFRCGVPDSTTSLRIPCMVAPGSAVRHPHQRTFSVGTIQIAAATMAELGRGTDNLYPNLRRVGVPVRLG
jgi:hypothetical protein